MEQEETVNYEQRLRQGGDWMLREASAYFAGAGQLRSILQRLTQRLDAEGISYALLGGLALAELGYPRLTEDIDLLLTPSGLDQLRQHGPRHKKSANAGNYCSSPPIQKWISGGARFTLTLMERVKSRH